MSIISPSRIILNHSYEEGEEPNAESLLPGEIALNAHDDVLFYLNSDGDQVKRIPIGLDNLNISSILLQQFGENLLENAIINSDGDLILTYKSGNPVNLGNIKGPRGTGIQIDGTVEYQSQLPTGNNLSPILNKSGTTYVVTKGTSPGNDYTVDPGVARIFIYDKPSTTWNAAGKLSNTLELDGGGQVTFATNPTISGSLTLTSSSGSSSLIQAPLGSNQGLILRAGGSTTGSEGGNIELTSAGDVNIDANITRIRSLNGSSTQLTIGNNGNVGIGTTVLTNRLNVDGTISSNNLTTTGPITGGVISGTQFQVSRRNGTGDAEIIVGSNRASGTVGNSYIDFISNASTSDFDFRVARYADNAFAADNAFTVIHNTGTDNVLNISSPVINFGTSATVGQTSLPPVRMSIRPDGRIGIGTGTPSSALQVIGDVTANNFIGNASTATRLQNSRNITFSGIITGSSSFDGTSNISIETSLANSSITESKISDNAVTKTKIADQQITAQKLDGGQTGTAPIYGARAWAKLNPYVGSVRTGAYKTGTYITNSIGGITTITIPSHGLKANDQIRLDFTSGNASDGLQTVISKIDENTFTISSAGGTSGNVTAQFVAIQGSGNISSASWYNSGDEIIVFNFTTPMPNINYVINATGQHYPGQWVSTVAEATFGTTQINTIYQGYIYMQQDRPHRFLNVVVFG
jgi:hypothetical protein